MKLIYRKLISVWKLAYLQFTTHASHHFREGTYITRDRALQCTHLSREPLAPPPWSSMWTSGACFGTPPFRIPRTSSSGVGPIPGFTPPPLATLPCSSARCWIHIDGSLGSPGRSSVSRFSCGWCSGPLLDCG